MTIQCDLIFAAKVKTKEVWAENIVGHASYKTNECPLLLPGPDFTFAVTALFMASGNTRSFYC